MVSWPDIRLRLIRVTAGLVMVAALVSLAYRLVISDGDGESAVPQRFLVIKVIDGDTAVLSGGDRLRLANIDAPEEGEPFYNEATQLLSELILGRQVHLVFNGPRRDKYGRLLAMCYADTILVGEQLLRQGMAYLLLFEAAELKRPEIQRLLEAQRQALKEGAGIHGLDREPEEYYLAHPNSFRFHRPGCRYLEGDVFDDHLRRLTTRQEALYEGLAPCRRCRP